MLANASIDRGHVAPEQREPCRRVRFQDDRREPYTVIGIFLAERFGRTN